MRFAALLPRRVEHGGAAHRVLKEAEQYPISVALAYAPPSETSVQLVCCILVVLPALFLFTFFNRELCGRHCFSGGEVI